MKLYMVVKTLKDEAIGLLDQQPMVHSIEVCLDDDPFTTGWVGYDTNGGDTLRYFDTLRDIEYILHPITKEEYETYQAFGLFDGQELRLFDDDNRGDSALVKRLKNRVHRVQ